jgi:hypothetical protein
MVWVRAGQVLTHLIGSLFYGTIKSNGQRIYGAMKQKKRGRPTVDTEAVNVRMAAETLAKLDDWRRDQQDLPTRPEAIRRLVETALRKR